MSDPPAAAAVSTENNRRVGSWIRIVVVLAIAFTVCFPVLFVVALQTFAGARLGWVPSLLCFGLLGFVTAWLAVSRRWPSTRRRLSIALAVLGGIAGIATAHWAPPTPGRLRHEIEGFVQPGWRLTNDSVEGSTFCFDYCRAVTRQYHVDDSPPAVVEALRPTLARHGLLQPLPALSRDRFEFADRGGGDVVTSLQVEPDTSRGSNVTITATAN